MRPCGGFARPTEAKLSEFALEDRRRYHRTMGVRPLLVLSVLLACSGVDGPGQGSATLRPGSTVTATAIAAASATPPPVTSAATPGISPTPAPAGPVADLTDRLLAPYFSGGTAGKASAAFARGEWKAARALFVAANRGKRGADAARFALLIASCDAELAAWPEAARGFAAARSGLPALADYLNYREAAALYFGRRFGAALQRANAVGPQSIVGADAELLIGDILRTQGDSKAVVEHYRSYLQRRKNGVRREEASYRLAEALQQIGGPAEIQEALPLYRTLSIESPLSRWGISAQEQLSKLVAALPEKQREQTIARTAGEQIRLGMELFDAMRNPESEAAFDQALAESTISPAERCIAGYHRAQSRFKARDRKVSAPMFDQAAAWCKSAGDTDKEIKSNYQAGRAYAFIGQHEVAVARYQRAQQISPAHSFADDSLLREAEEWDSLKKDDDVTRVLSSLPGKYPSGDMRAEAMWRLGWRAWRNRQLREAIQWWQKQIEVMPIDDNYWAEGQAQYWIGRAHLALGNKARALEVWEQGIRDFPAAYYAMLALNRIRETAPERFTKLVAELAADPVGFDASKPAFTFTPRPQWASPGFARAVELLRLGLGEPARAELRLLGLAAPANKQRVDDPDLADKLWAMAFLFDRSGDYESSHWPTRWHILDYRRSWPVGSNRARWQIAYPRAFLPLLTEHANRNQVPLAMQIAIVREESAFNPRLESYANAIGLTQMIASTAARFAKGTGIDPTRESLRDPEKNVTIGSRFLGFLFQRWNRFTLLVPPSYNAGETAVKRMLAARGTWDADEFIEGIIDDQARNYSKRVLGTFFTYSWLYDQVVPTIPNLIPPDLLPKP
jgi:soluble lytic murein transglycosylase